MRKMLFDQIQKGTSIKTAIAACLPPNGRSAGVMAFLLLAVLASLFAADTHAQVNNPATGQPSITGTAQVGETLTAGTDDIEDDDGLEDATFSYQWVRVDNGTDTDITDATSSSYTLTDDDAGKQVRVRVSFTDDEGNSEQVTSDAWPSEGSIVGVSTAVVLSLSAGSVGEDAGATSITVTGTLNGLSRTSDTTVTVVVGASGDAAAEGTDYATVADLTLTIDAGETMGTASFTLTPTDDDVDEGDETLSVTGTTTETDLSVVGTTATIVDADTHARTNSPASGEPSISGVPQVGETLTVDTDDIADSDGLGTFSYQWSRLGGGTATNIGGATSHTYEPVAEDVGKKVRVQVSFTDGAGNAETLTSNAYPSRGYPRARIAAAKTPCPPDHDWCAEMTVGYGESPASDYFHYGFGPRYDGVGYWGTLSDRDITVGNTTFRVERMVVAIRPEWDFPLVWVGFTNDERVLDGTVFNLGGSTFTADGDSWFEYSSGGGRYIFPYPTGLNMVVGQKMTVSVKFATSATAATGHPSITGTPQVGETLTVNTDDIADTDGLGTFSYQWIRVGGNTVEDISGATSSTYIAAEADVGKKLKVEVSFTDGEGNAEAVTSDAFPSLGFPLSALSIVSKPMLCPMDSDWCAELTVGYHADPAQFQQFTLYGFMPRYDVNLQWDEGDGYWGSLSNKVLVYGDTSLTFHKLGIIDYRNGYTVAYAAFTKDERVPDGTVFNYGGTTFTANADNFYFDVYGRGGHSFNYQRSFSVMVGQKMTVSVKFPAAGTSATGQPSITGTAQVGETLTAGTDDIEDDDGLEDATFSYQWVRVDNGTDTDITDATSSSYTLTDDDAGKQVRVRVSFTDDEGNSEQVTSDAWPSEGSIVGVSTAVVLSLSAGSVGEDAGATSITVTGTLNGLSRTSDTTVTVVVGASGAAAAEGTDYATVADLTLTIDAGETMGTASFTLTPTDDDVDEGDETLSVTGTTTETDLSVVGTTATIVDDDERGVAVSTSTLSVPEGGTATYTVALESQPTGTVTVTLSVSGDGDVTVSPSSLSFGTGDWNTAKTVTVSAAQDADAADDAATVSHAVSGGDYASETASDVGVTVSDDDADVPADSSTVVPSNWALIPAGLSPGDEFRLLAKTKSPLKPDSTSTDLADYNDYVQEQIRSRGHVAAQAYAGDFRVLGSTAAVNARTNTGTTGSGGVPIYWLNGERVADDYGDFYDGTWSSRNSGRGVAGDLIVGDSASGRQLLCTGTADDGTTTNLPLGGGDPDNDSVNECTATSIAITSGTLSGDVVDVSGMARYLAVSNVFRISDSVVVPGNWALIPAGLGAGDEFRLLAKTKSPLKPDSTSADIADYNGYVQEQVRSRGHMAVQDYAGDFRVLGSTAAMNARTNTGTTGSGGVPIYWLNGARVADDYGDFYDGTWSNKNNGRGVAGDLITDDSASARQLLCTGTADDGTTTDLPLGGGDPNNDSVNECTATSIAITSNTLDGDVLDVSGRARYLALSNVFQVGSAVVPVIEEVSISSDAGGDREYKVGDDIRITATFSEAVTVTSSPRMLFRMDALDADGDPVERNRSAGYDAGMSTSTELVFSYTVRSVDFDRDGIRVRADSLRLNGGAIRNGAGDTDAVLDHEKVEIQSEHRIHVPASAAGARVVSTPAVGTSYSTGETITVEVAFDRDVRVITEDGTPTYEMRFGTPGAHDARHAAYARVVNGNKVQFDYVVAADDRDPDGFGAMEFAVRWNGGVITRAEVDARIAIAVRATVSSTYLLRQDGHAVNAE